jgi:hypothetical protein
MKALTDTDQRVMLREITLEQANAATATIAGHATSRTDLLALLDMIRPAPYTPCADPSRRRAQPRWLSA